MGVYWAKLQLLDINAKIVRKKNKNLFRLSEMT